MPSLSLSDLRLHDNPLLQLANAPNATTHVLPVCVFDDRIVDCSSLPGYKGLKGAATSRVLQIPRCGAHRTKCVGRSCLSSLQMPGAAFTDALHDLLLPGF